MRILQISTYDKGGGAEAIAWQLFSEYRRRGHRSTMVVGEKRTTDPDIISAPSGSTISFGGWTARLSQRLLPYEGRVRGAWRMRRWLEAYAAHPTNWVQTQLGRENFNFPGTWRLLELLKDSPDILHCHNLHGGWLPQGGYFDLRALPWLSRQVPTLITLHDTWMLSGHCAYTLGCDRWKTGCGQCPDLSIYPALLRDGTTFNWRRKKSIYADSRLYIATPSRWLMHQVEQSMLSPAMVEGRVIPNGVDTTVFLPGPKERARDSLGLPRNAKILLFVANAAKQNPFKDYKTVEECVFRVGVRYRNQKVLFVVLGQAEESVFFENGEIRFFAFHRDRGMMARFYQAADIYVHAAKSDTFPNTVLEALACGLPVVATAVDGIPEQVEEGRSGFLVPPGDAEAMAARATQLLSNETLRTGMGAMAAERAAGLFGLPKQVDAYLGWFEQIFAHRTRDRAAAHAC
jgi:glycosyltransferase involved in cell wall biosynthesis